MSTTQTPAALTNIDLPETEDLGELAEMTGGETDREGVVIEGPKGRLVLYWDSQDPTCTGWAWALHPADENADIESGPLDSMQEVAYLKTRIA